MGLLIFGNMKNIEPKKESLNNSVFLIQGIFVKINVYIYLKLQIKLLSKYIKEKKHQKFIANDEYINFNIAKEAVN